MSIAAVIGVLRLLVFVAAVIAAVVCLLDWLVRTRRIGPFNPVSRFVRRIVDPLIAPIERRVVRAGGLPSSAPWWALAAIVIGGIVLITVLESVVGFAFRAGFLVRQGAGGITVLLLDLTFGILRIAILLTVLVSWLPISPHSPWVRWAFAFSEPILRPLRQIIPSLGGLDVTPIVAYFGLNLLHQFLVRLVVRG